MSYATRMQRLAALLALMISGAAAAALGLARTPVAQGAASRYVATTGSDTGSCANSMSPCRTIGYAIGQALAGDTIVIAIGVYTEHLTIDKPLSFSGAGASATAIDGGQQSSVLVIDTAASVTITDVTIRNGRSTATGGGIENRGSLILNSSVVSGNTAVRSGGSPCGGGIYNAGTLILHTSVVSGNTARGDGDPYGGGIYNAGTLTMDTSVASGNTTVGSFAQGGGIYNAGGAHATLFNSRVAQNTATYFAAGGGIRNIGAMELIGSTVNWNSASGRGGGGGGIRNTGTLTLTNSTINGNTADYSGSSGGGISNSGILASRNSTITQNSTRGAAYGHGGGIYNEGTLKIWNTILAQNLALDNDMEKADDCWGALTSEGHNLLGDATGCTGLANGVNNDRVGTGGNPLDPRLGALRDNGGPTPTQALLVGSPALDAGDNSGCPPTDQRGISRPFDGNGDGIAVCDIGAVEMAVVVRGYLYLPVIARIDTRLDLAGSIRRFP